MADGRETMFAYTTKATFLGSHRRECRFMTALCPDRCGHAQTVFAFRLDSLSVEKNAASSHAKWVTPMTQGSELLVASSDLHEHLALAQSLSRDAVVELAWSHDYVTVDGDSGPQRPVKRLALADAGPAVERETLVSYTAKATFRGSEHRPCMFRTSLCPNDCGHEMTVFRFLVRFPRGRRRWRRSVRAAAARAAAEKAGSGWRRRGGMRAGP